MGLVDERKRKYTITLLLVLLFFTIYTIVYWLINKYVDFWNDFHLRWQECAYLLHGVNPFDAIEGRVLIDAIGSVSNFAGTVPWAYVLGQVINPGFLPYSSALPYGIITFVVLALIAVLCLYRYLSDTILSSEKKSMIVVFALILLLPFSWRDAFYYGNNAGIVCSLTVILMCQLGKRPALSGVLLALIMIKPQMGGIFVLILLFQKRWKTLIIAAALVFIAWVASFIITNTQPFEMLLSMLSQGTGYTAEMEAYMGLFDPLQYIGMDTIVILGLSILSGIAYFTGYYFYLKKLRLENDKLLIFSGAAITSTFWFYKQPHDLTVLALPGICAAIAYLYSHRSRLSFPVNTLWLIISLALLLTKPFKTIAPRIVRLLTDASIFKITSVCLTIERILIMFVGFSIVYIYSKSKLSDHQESQLCAVTREH